MLLGYMCGRIFCTLEPSFIQIELNLKSVRNAEKIKSAYNIGPTSYVPVVIHKEAVLDGMKWGFSSPSAPFIINGRSEEATEKPTFSHLLNSHRCYIVCEGYYEWKEDKQKSAFVFKPKDSKFFLIAALYRIVNDEKQVILLTKEANDFLLSVHHRMPVILTPSLLEKWNSSLDYKAFMESVEMELYTDCINFYRVSSRVNNIRNDGKECIEPYKETTNTIMNYFKKRKVEEQ